MSVCILKNLTHVPAGIIWRGHTFLWNLKMCHDGFNLQHLKAISDMRWIRSPHSIFSPPCTSIPIFAPNERCQLGSAGWCWALLGGIDSWIIPQAAAADYQRRSHQGVPASPSHPQSPISLHPLPSPPLRPPVTPRQGSVAFSKPAVLVLLTGNLNNNNYHHYWCHKQVANPKPGQ